MTIITSTVPAKTPTKKMTPAFKKADEHRDMMNNREGVEKLLCSQLCSVVYKYMNQNGQPCAIGYRGRAQKPAFNYRFQSVERRDEHAAEFIESNQKRATVRKETATRELNVGDVLKSSWGYEQTNIDYYIVTKLIGKTMVEIVEIGRESVETESMQGACIPDINNIIGAPMRKKATGKSVSLSSYSSAHLKEKVEISPGVKVFKADHWTAYH